MIWIIGSIVAVIFCFVLALLGCDKTATTQKTNNTTPIITPDTYDLVKNAQNKKKDSSVIGSAVVGSIIAGPVGGVVGAIHSADKNNRNKRR